MKRHVNCFDLPFSLTQDYFFSLLFLGGGELDCTTELFCKRTDGA